MSSVNKAESPEHKRLVKSLMEHLKKEGFETTCASYEGYTQCAEIEGHIPDVRGRDEEKELNAIGEAKTSDDLDNDRTKEQFKVFSNRIMSVGKSKGKDVPFYIGMTKGSEKQLEDCLKELGLDKKPNIYRIFF